MTDRRIATSLRAQLAAAAPPPVEQRATIPVATVLKGARGGRQVDPARGMALNLRDVTKRPFGREERTLEAIKALRDLDPAASFAVWNFVRMVNPGHDLRAYVGDGDAEKAEEGEAQAYLDSLAARVGSEQGGGLDQLHPTLALSLITNGAIAAECAPTAGLDDVEDWYPIDPAFIAFRRGKDKRLELGQKLASGGFGVGQFTPLPRPQVVYLPLDADVDDPYGRPPLLAAIGAVVSLAQMLNDLRAAAHNFGYPRLRVSVDYEFLKAMAPADLQTPGNEAQLIPWMDRQFGRLVDEYQALQTDDTLVAYDKVKPDLMGVQGGMFDFARVEEILVRRLNSALKTLPILLGVNETTTESHGSIQWQIQVAGIKTLQRLCKRVVEQLANVSLQLKGLQAHAKMEYEEIRTVDRLYEEQADVFQATSLTTDVKMGWRSNDEAAQIRTGHEAVAEPLSGAFAPPAPVAGNLSSQDQAPTNTEKQQGKSSATPLLGSGDAWKMLEELNRTLPAEGFARVLDGLGRRERTRRALAEAQAAYEAERSEPAFARLATAFRLSRALDLETVNDELPRWERKAARIFRAAGEDLIALLRENGYLTTEAHDEASASVRTVLARDIADSVFGLGYRRDMKRLLREAIAWGMKRGGVEDPEAPERIVRRIWADNSPYIDKIRDDLRAAIDAGKFHTLDDVTAWLHSNQYREELMGRFLAKQGIAAGYTDGVVRSNPAATFRWLLGDAQHCSSCLDRADRIFTADELLSVGYPGSDSLECKGSCKCWLEEVAEAAA